MAAPAATAAAATPTATAVPATATPIKTTSVTVMLDWVPNTNHTGLYVAEAKGYFKNVGLNVKIVQPGEVYAEQAVASGAVEFGISFQEQITLSRAANPPAPLVSIAAIIQHNTSGFAALSDKGITSPKQWEGLTYGSFASPFEEPTLRALMTCAGGDYSKLKIVNAGNTDPVALLSTKQVDVAWIFAGWEAIQAKQQGVNLTTVMMSDYTDCIPDYYTPVLITSEKMIKDKPEVVKAFMLAVSQGYTYAIQNPDDAAAILTKAVPAMDAKLVKESQEWLSPRYQADAARWGEQKQSVWEAYSSWMAKNGVIDKPIDTAAAFTNDFLP